MYTEGYIIEIDTMGDSSLFKLEPAAPYQFRRGESTYVLLLKQGPIFDDQGKMQGLNSCQAIIDFIRRLELVCKKDLADFSSLVAIKASHSRIGVEFDGEKMVSKIVVM